MESKSKPNWWVVFAMVPLMIIALLIESQFKYSVQVHEVVDYGIVIATFSLMAGWAQANRAAIEEEENAHENWKIEVVEPTESTTQEAKLLEAITESEDTLKSRAKYVYAGLDEWNGDSNFERRN